MHYYPFNIGDYIRDTAHLAPMEDLVYRRLIDLYYLKEAPIAFDETLVARLIRLPEHADVVGRMLVEFFERDDAGWRNPRCDREIDTYHRRVAGGAKGGRRSAAVRSRSGQGEVEGEVEGEVDHGVKQPRTSNQEPITSNQEPRSEEKEKKLLSGKPDVPAQKVDAGTQSEPELELELDAGQGADPDAGRVRKSNGEAHPGPDAGQDANREIDALIEHLNQRAGKAFRPVEANRKFVRGRLKEGFTTDDVRAVIDAKVAQWKGDSKMADFLRPGTLFNATNFAQYHGSLPKRAAGQTDWWAQAGFADAWDANNLGCNRTNFREFSGGQRISGAGNPRQGVQAAPGSIEDMGVAA